MLKTPEAPDVGVLITAYNAGATISSAIESSLSDEVDLEIVLALDGCTDNTLERALACARGDRRLRIINLPRVGRGAALNIALAEIKAPKLAILDADDETLPGRLALQMGVLTEQGPQVAGVGGLSSSSTRLAVGPRVVAPRDVTASLRRGNPFVHSSMMFRTETVRSVGGYDVLRRGNYDYDLYVRLASSGHRLLHVDLPMVYNRKSKDSFFEGRGGLGYRYDSLCVQRSALRQIPGPTRDWALLAARSAYPLLPRRVKRAMGARSRLL